MHLIGGFTTPGGFHKEILLGQRLDLLFFSFCFPICLFSHFNMNSILFKSAFFLMNFILNKFICRKYLKPWNSGQEYFISSPVFPMGVENDHLFPHFQTHDMEVSMLMIWRSQCSCSLGNPQQVFVLMRSARFLLGILFQDPQVFVLMR